MVFSVNYNGLKKRESYDDLVRYIETDPNKIKYPDRRATQLEQSHYMKHLGAEDYDAMEEEQMRANKEHVKEAMIRETASRGEGSGGGTSSLLRHEATRKEPPPVAASSVEPPPPTAPVAPSAPIQRGDRRSERRAKQFGQAVEDAVEGEREKKTEKRFENLAMVAGHLSSDVPMVVEAANQAGTARGKLRAQRSQKPLVQQALETPDEPMIQFVGEPTAPEQDKRFSKGEMRRMRKKGAFPEPSGEPVSLAPSTPAVQQVRDGTPVRESTPAGTPAPAIPEGGGSFAAARRRRLKEKGPNPYKMNPRASSSGDPAGSSSSAEYQRRLREEELLRLEHERLVSQRLQEEAEGQAQAQKEARRGRSPTVKKKPEAEEARVRSRSRKKKENAMALDDMTKTEKKDEKKRQKEEEAEKREEKKPKKESKTQYFSIGDIERPKTKKQEKEDEKRRQKEEEKADKEDKRKRARTEKDAPGMPEPEQEQKPAKAHGTKIDNKKTKSYWEKKSNAYIVDQLSLHGVRIDPWLLSGRKQEFDVVKDKNVTVKVKKITKEELLNVLYKELKMS